MSETELLEPSFADALSAIEKAADLPVRTRSHWTCSLRQIAKAIDKPAEIIPARWTAVRFVIGRLHHARIGSNQKTLANHKSNVRAALLWFAGEKGVPSRGMAFAADWASLRKRLVDLPTRANLSPLMRYCSARRIAPGAVDEAVIDDYMRYRAETTALSIGDRTRRAVARAWNNCVGIIAGWPDRQLVEPAIKSMASPAWDEFPIGLRTDIDSYLAGLSRIRRGSTGKRIRPCKASTIRARRAELVAAARMAVREGVPIANLTSLGAMLASAVVEKIIDGYWKADGSEPTIYTIDLGWKLLSIARQIGCLKPEDLQKLDDIRAALEDHRHGGLTEKNLAVIRQVLTGHVWSEVVNLPAALMAHARLARDHAPVKAAVAAQMAVAIAILTFAPIRLGNLVRIRLDENLIKPGGPGAPYMLVFPEYDVKNRVKLEFLLDAELTALIDEYIHEFRSSLLRGSNELWLFPGETWRVQKRERL